jgi:hypothetical protein
MTKHINSCYLISFLVFVFNLPVSATESVLIDPDALNPEKIIYLDQNWSEKDRQYFYFTDQGSRFMNYEIFANLEQSDGKSLFRSPENMLRYGYIPVPASKKNPDGLPIGFTTHDGQLGFTCAACHTQQIKYGGKFIRIDGGQAMADFPGFREDLEQALTHTLNDPEAFIRFEQRVLGENAAGNKSTLLKSKLEKEYATLRDYNQLNHTEVEFGFSRLDAFGAILNKGLNLTGVENNYNPPNAPTSYPYMWDTPQHDYVEWNGSQANSHVGALARNVGEVIGVFGQVNTTPKKWLFFFDGGYKSSIKARNLRRLEMLVSRLHSPLWTESLPPINQAKAEQGKPLYAKYCAACHEDINRTDPERRIIVRMSSLAAIKTDPLMATNALEHKGKSGIFAGKPRFYQKGAILEDEAPALFIVNNVMVGVLKNNPLQVLLAKRDARKLGHGEEIHPPKYLDGEIMEHGTETSDKALLAYKARPLNGIWTGAPYLHNGSVPNLYQLLLPADQRDKTFYIGSWEFDPVNVGYVTHEEPGAFLFDTTLEGNSNSGHEYGTGYDGLPPLTEDDIWALIEYMKTL